MEEQDTSSTKPEVNEGETGRVGGTLDEKRAQSTLLNFHKYPRYCLDEFCSG